MDLWGGGLMRAGGGGEGRKDDLFSFNLLDDTLRHAVFSVWLSGTLLFS